MFGMGFFEIFLIATVAIIALGPEKLPTAMVEVARFFKKFKSGIDEAKSTLDNELQLSDMREEASKFKAQIDNVKSTVNFEGFDLGVNNILDEELTSTSTATKPPIQKKTPLKKKETPLQNSEKPIKRKTPLKKMETTLQNSEKPVQRKTSLKKTETISQNSEKPKITKNTREGEQS